MESWEKYGGNREYSRQLEEIKQRVGVFHEQTGVFLVHLGLIRGQMGEWRLRAAVFPRLLSLYLDKTAVNNRKRPGTGSWSNIFLACRPFMS